MEFLHCLYCSFQLLIADYAEWGMLRNMGGQLATEKFSARMIPWSAVSRSQIQYEAGTAIFIH